MVLLKFQSLILSAALLINRSAPLFISSSCLQKSTSGLQMNLNVSLRSIQMTFSSPWEHIYPRELITWLAKMQLWLVEVTLRTVQKCMHVFSQRCPPVRQNAPLIDKRAPLVSKFSLWFKWPPMESPTYSAYEYPWSVLKQHRSL